MRIPLLAAFAAPIFLVTASSIAAKAATLRVPVECSRGGEHIFEITLTLPASARPGERASIRIDGAPSGKLSNVGLNYIHDMATDFQLSGPVTYVPGSLRTVPGTGTPNVRAGALAWHDSHGIHQLLPRRVRKGSEYTPPSMVFEVDVTGNPGSTVTIELDQFRLKANVVILGDLTTVCNPRPRPYGLAKLRVRSMPNRG